MTDTGTPTLLRDRPEILLLLTGILAATSGPFLGFFAGASLLAGGIAAIVMNAWNVRHPSLLAVPARSRVPEINFSSTTVGGDIVGLIVAAGSVAIIIAGLPGVRWYLLAALACGLVCATALRSRRAPGAHRALLGRP